MDLDIQTQEEPKVGGFKENEEPPTLEELPVNSKAEEIVVAQDEPEKTPVLQGPTRIFTLSNINVSFYFYKLTQYFTMCSVD